LVPELLLVELFDLTLGGLAGLLLLDPPLRLRGCTTGLLPRLRLLVPPEDPTLLGLREDPLRTEEDPVLLEGCLEPLGRVFQTRVPRRLGSTGLTDWLPLAGLSARTRELPDD
jgi:hypothetical protein